MIHDGWVLYLVVGLLVDARAGAETTTLPMSVQNP